MKGEKSEQIPESIKDARAYSLQKKHGKKIITLGNPRSDSKDLENLFMDKERKDDRIMSWDLKCTITVDENEIKELADGLGNKYTTTIEELSKENNELRSKNDILESRLHASESEEKEEEDDSCNPESTEYQHQVKIKTLEDKIEFLKDTQRVIIQSLQNDCRQFSTNGDCRMYHHECHKNCHIFKLIVKYNIP